MDLSLDEASAAARDLVEAVLARHPGLAAARAAEPLGYDPKLWAELCAAGLPGLAVGVEHDGGGAGLHASVIAAVELGRGLAPVPFAEHVAAARLLAAVAPGHPDLPAVVAGELVATLATRVRAGLGVAVPAGAVAGLVLAVVDGQVVAKRGEPPAATANQGDLPVADRDLAGAVVLGGEEAVTAFARARAEWLVLVAGWLAGLADGALGLATRWVKERVQFGVPVGSFQGVQHGLADLPGLVDASALLAREAAWSLESGQRSVTGADGRQLAFMAALFATDAARQSAERAVQYHGGLGVAVEHDAQLYFRRARAYPALAGAPRALARELGRDLVDNQAGDDVAPTAAAAQADGGPGFAHSPAVAAFAAEVRAFTRSWLTDEVRAQARRTGTVHVPALHRALAERGWLAASAPGERAARDPFELGALFRELELADAPYHGIGTTMIVAGVLDQLGSPALRAEVLPRLLAGEATAVLGYSEPGAGSDVASARTRAVPVDDARSAWRIDGQKMWTTLAHTAAHCLLLTRTNPDVPKHRGLTMFLVPMDTPGITIQPIHTIADERTNVVFYDDVIVPDSCRIGEVDGGWRVMAVGLSLERGVMGSTAMLEPLLAAVTAWARVPGPAGSWLDGERPGDDPAVLTAIARARADAEAAFLLTQWTAWLNVAGQSPAVAGTIAKLFASTAYQRASRELQDVAGLGGILRASATGGVVASAADGEIERAARHSCVVTIQGGTTEIARNLVAEQRLGLPKTRQGTRSQA
ncbi:acyl-CoA dehydrogenase [Frankia sp. AgB1.9]|uniref:acyl-CoA dehydrogenase n=3 Tax=Frankia TaxID=1854 RepID=UPI001933EF6D|nr:MULTISPECIES: acyl-CoA dehydrogenase [unclassified Frankia]MBL7548716.1 acyl-CoA dehydrogenase [Frankia sp. AgB1.9]MBL7619314.1 acyl-CoA dehydrogenase [Frankia sp. AgB1.8]